MAAAARQDASVCVCSLSKHLLTLKRGSGIARQGASAERSLHALSGWELTVFAAKGFELYASLRVNEEARRALPEEEHAHLFLGSLNDSGRA